VIFFNSSFTYYRSLIALTMPVESWLCMNWLWYSMLKSKDLMIWGEMAFFVQDLIWDKSIKCWLDVENWAISIKFVRDLYLKQKYLMSILYDTIIETLKCKKNTEEGQFKINFVPILTSFFDIKIVRFWTVQSWFHFL